MNRANPPKYTQATELKIQLPKEIILENGISLFINNNVKDNAVKMDIEWSAGTKYQSKKMVANFTNKLLLSGNENNNAASIAEKIDFYGGFLQHEIDRDHGAITLYGLVDNMAAIFTTFSDAFLNCTFPVKELEKERSVALANYKVEAEKGKNICRREFTKAVFGENSDYGQVAVEVDFKNVNQTDLINYYQTFYLNNKPTIFVVGNVGDDFIEELRKWSSNFSATKANYIPKDLVQKTGRIDIPVEKAMQSAIRFGRLMFDKNHPDYFNFQLMNTVLGGYFGSRLSANLREDKGFTYGVGSGLSVMENAAYFYISTEVAVAVKENAITEIFNEINRLQTELISVEELNKVKNYMLGDFLRQADGSIAMMENFKNIYFNNLKNTYYSDFIQAINKATPEQLKEIALKYLNKKDLIIVTAG